MTPAEPVRLLLAAAELPPPSDKDAHQLEEALLPFCDLEPIDGLVEVLATYTPLETVQPGESDRAALQSAARDALHDLGEHSQCSHDV